MKLLSKIYIITIILFSLGLYEIRGLGIIVRLLDIATVILIITAIILIFIYGKPVSNIKSQFKTPILLILIGVFVSSFAAELFHNQALHLTFYQQRHMYAFFFYFLLIYIAPKPEWLINVLFYFGLFGGLFFLTQYILFPTLITDAKIFLDRGTIRMNLPGTYYMHIAFFLSVDRFFTTYEKRYGFGILLLLLVTILSGFRSTVAIYILITTGFLLVNKQVKNKIALSFLYLTIVVAGFFAFENIFQEMLESAERESAQGTSYIRFRAAEHLISINNENKITYIIGNGEPTERSEYGLKLRVISMMSGFYLSDIGIFGFYIKYGLLSALVVLFIILKLSFARINRKIYFIKLFFIFNLFMVATTRTPFEVLPSIVLLCILMYLYDFFNQKEILTADS